MSIRRRRRLDPVPHEPSHRRVWRSWWRRCSCGLPAPCVDRLVPAPRLPFPPARNERSAPVTGPQPGGDTGDVSTPDVASAWHYQASRPASAPTGPGAARALACSAHPGATHEIIQAADSGARKAHVEAPTPGSHVADSRPADPPRPGPRPARAGAAAADSPCPDVTTPLVPHPATQIGGLFDGLLLVDPGLLSPGWWRPAPDLDPGEDTRPIRAGVSLPAH
jgi:hypothetical protein